MRIESRSKKLLYQRVYSQLKEKIEKGDLPHGEIIPTECDLAVSFGVSRVTVRRALLQLEREKYVLRRRGYGTEVSHPPVMKRDEKAVAVLLPAVTRSFFAEILKGIQDRLDREGYKLLLCDTGNLGAKERDCLQKYRAAVAGFIVAPATDNQNHAYYGELLAEKVSFVFVDRYLPEFSVDAVYSDNVQGGYLATKHLLELGHRRIAVLSEPAATSLLERIEGYRKALGEAGISADDGLLRSGGERAFLAGYHLISDVVEERPKVTAAFCLNDEIAWGALKRLGEMKIRVPQDFSLVGYDNLDFTTNVVPPLTTINQPKYLMGERAADIVLGRIAGRLIGRGKELRLPVELILRETSGRARLKGSVRTASLRGGVSCVT